MSNSSSPRKSCQVIYTSVVFDWQRAISEIGSLPKPPTPSDASIPAITVVESSSGFVVVCTSHTPCVAANSATVTANMTANAIFLIAICLLWSFPNGQRARYNRKLCMRV